MKVLYQRPVPISLNAVEFNVLSAEDQTRYADFIARYGAGICLSPQAYENLGINMQEVLRYIRQMNALVEQYETDRIDDNRNIVKSAGGQESEDRK